MLFKHKQLLAELRKKGRRATAGIVSVRTVGEGSSIRALRALRENLTSGWIDCLTRLWIIPEQRDRPPFEAMALAGRCAG
jgi:hypothetical protein